MKCSKCFLIFINVVYLCASVLIVAAGTIAKIFFGDYDFLSDGIEIFSTLWIAAGCCLLLISIYGIIISFGNSTILTNVILLASLTLSYNSLDDLSLFYFFFGLVTSFYYTFALAAVVALQICAAIAGFSISACRSKEITSDTLISLIESHDHNDTTSREAIDWIQTKYQCCGVKSPDDWHTLKLTEAATNTLPLSCCTREIGESSSQCSNYYKNGCLNPVQEMASNNVAMISLVALGIAVGQLIGVLAAFLHNRAIRNSQKLDDIDYSELKIKNNSFY